MLASHTTLPAIIQSSNRLAPAAFLHFAQPRPREVDGSSLRCAGRVLKGIRMTCSHACVLPAGAVPAALCPAPAAPLWLLHEESRPLLLIP